MPDRKDPGMPTIPDDAAVRRAVPPVICYPTETLPVPDMALYAAAREQAEKLAEVVVPPREAEQHQRKQMGEQWTELAP